MQLGVRRKIFFSVFSVIFVIIAVLGYFMANFLKDNLIERIVDELTRHAESSSLAVEIAADISTIEVADPLADKLGKAIGARVTVVQENGRVIGDSELDLKEIETVESHGDRYEVIQALATGSGSSKRFSHTLGTDMLYVTSRYSRGNERGVVRVSRSLLDVTKSVSLQIKSLIIAAALIGLLIALVVSGISSQMLSRILGTLVNFARETAEGTRRGPIVVSSQDELGGLAGSLNRLSEQVEKHVTTLAEERDGFEAVLNGMNDAVLALDDQNRVTLINRAAVMLLDLGDGPIGQTLLDTIGVPALHELVVKVGRERAGQVTSEFELPGENVRKILARASGRKSGGVVVVLQDVTELRHLENLRKDFVSNVSHELRTPVSIMRAGAETLLDGAMDDKDAAKRFLNSILTNAERLSNLIADLLDISRIEEGKYELTIEPVPVSLAMKRAAAALETHAIEKNFTIRVEPSDNLVALGDGRAIDQILFNFTDNAVKYAGTGGHVILRARQVEDHIRIEVEDDGPGIEPKYRARLFERFYRVDPGRSREMGGTGLGLAIVKHLATVMDGEVGMDPAEPTGSIFWLLLDQSN